MDAKKDNNLVKNFWEEPAFYFIVGAIILTISGNLLRSWGVNISDEEIENIISSAIGYSILAVILFFLIKNYKVVLSLVGVLIIIGLIFGIISWFFALPATTIIIILLILLVFKK
jgi:hypothetical protein